jgi:hypothetical protein
LKEFAKKLKNNEVSSARCPNCGDQISPDQFFPDKAASRELNALSVSCPNIGCQWEGLYRDYFETHLGGCPEARVKCPHEKCTECVLRKNLNNHIRKCGYRPEQCHFCGRSLRSNEMDEHYEMCDQFPVKCTEGCGEEVPRESLKTHIIEDCPKIKRVCRYSPVGCKFEGSGEDMILHEQKYAQFHLRMMWNWVQEAMKTNVQTPHTNHSGSIEASMNHIEKRTSELTRQQGDNMVEIQKLKAESHARAVAVEDAIGKIQRSVKELQEFYTDVATSIQTIQASSHGPVYIWKIPDLSRRRREAVLGKTVSLYSAPFYTSRHGYKICLRVYLNGDGAGRGTHLSFFMTLMKGDFDGLLPWPFKQTTTLMLLAQDRTAKDISQSFKPDLVSGSFVRPKTEMNVASGCPQFCPLSILDNPAYIQNDTLYLKCAINTSGIEHIT